MKAVRGGLILLLFSFLFITGIASAQVENQDCLECHGTKDILTMSEEERLELVIPTPGKEEVRKAALTLYLDYDRFRASVHGDLDCVDCHTEIGEIPHPQRMIWWIAVPVTMRSWSSIRVASTLRRARGYVLNVTIPITPSPSPSSPRRRG